MPDKNYPKHDGGSSITQDSVKVSRDNPGRPSTYTSGSNVHKGGGGSKTAGQAPASQPKGQTY